VQAKDAVDIAAPGDEIVVTNGLYSGSSTNRVDARELIRIRSVNGPAVTTIQGLAPGETKGIGVVRCAYLENGAALDGFALTGGNTFEGAGAVCASDAEVVSNCTLINRKVVDNLGGPGPVGVTYSLVYNPMIYSNAPRERDYSTSLFNSCSTDIHPDDERSLTNLPLFVDLQSGDFRLQSNSPCINAGNNAYLSTGIDLDGNPRVSGGTVDIRAYEFQNPTSIISNAWLEQYRLPTDNSAESRINLSILGTRLK
jgi:hypothetical protein